MGTRYRYHGRPWPNLPQRDIEADEAPSFGAVLTDAAARGAYVPEPVAVPGEVWELNSDGTSRQITDPAEISAFEAAAGTIEHPVDLEPAKPAPRPTPRRRKATPKR